MVWKGQSYDGEWENGEMNGKVWKKKLINLYYCYFYCYSYFTLNLYFEKRVFMSGKMGKNMLVN
jgi:hypothetical protein